MHIRTGLPGHNQAYVHMQDYAYAIRCPKNLITQKTEQEQKEPNSNLACIEPKQNYILT